MPGKIVGKPATLSKAQMAKRVEKIEGPRVNVTSGRVERGESRQPILTVFINLWGSTVGAGDKRRYVVPKPWVRHNGRKVEFEKLANARAFAFENGYGGVRVEVEKGGG